MALTTEAQIRAAIPNGDSLAASVVAGLLSAADAAAKTYLRRTLEAGEYRERVRAARRGEDVQVAEYPVTSVLSVGFAYSAALELWNNGAAKATASVTDAGLVLREFVSGAWSVNTLLWAAYPTLSQLAAAVAAVSGLRWDADLRSEVTGEEPSEDLGELEGPIDVSGGKPKVLLLLDGSIETVWDHDAGTFVVDDFGPREGDTLLVRYAAGYATVPADVQRGVAMLAAELYAASQATSGMKKEKLGDYEYERFEFGPAVLTQTVKLLLGPWRRLVV